MLKIYNPTEARQSILRRDNWLERPVPASLAEGMKRIFGQPLTPEEAVVHIVEDVRKRGDEALRHWSERIDDTTIENFAVPQQAITDAASAIPSELYQALQLAAGRIRDFHSRQPLPNWTTTELGGTIGQRVTPLRRVGIYVPGGTAPLPSSLLMAAIPAQVAGVEEIIVATPPKGPNGGVPKVILAAAEIAGVGAIYTVGGAQAVAALAYGTETIPAVDKIVGPGNLFVTLAKRRVYGQVGIDGLYGPTETLVIADEWANAAWVAADLLAQAEHDVLAAAILLTPSRKMAEAVQVEAGRQLEQLSRSDIIAAALDNQGGIVLTRDLDEAAELADAFAAEHLCLDVQDPVSLMAEIGSAGGFFLGGHSFEVLGDYVAGPSHTMPTGGTARFASPLNVFDFVRINSVVALDEATSAELSKAAAMIARAEQLTAHANAAEQRASGEGEAMIRQQKNNSFDPAILIRPDIAEMEPYVPIVPFDVLSARLGREPEQIIKLDANENPYGPSPRALQALQSPQFWHIYPDPESTALRQALVDYTGVPADYLLAGAGADELIDLVLRALLEPGDSVVNCPPSFGMYPFSTTVNMGQMVQVPRRANFSLDIEGIEATLQNAPRAKVLFICSPNNPDGSVISDAALQRLLALPLLVILDEAYVEFSGNSRIDWVPQHDNLVVLRTFSKWAGLAGLRVGYGAFPTWLMPHLWKIKQPYNVNVPAGQAAIASLVDVDYLLQQVAAIAAERERLQHELATFEFLQPYPSQSNFVLCRVSGRDAAELKQKLEQEGILVRYFAKPGLENCIRISAGRPEDSERLLDTLRNI